MYCSTRYSSPVGILTLASDGENLTGLWIEGQKYHGADIYGPMPENDAPPVFSAAKGWLSRYFAGEKPAVTELKLAPSGSDFRTAIWDILCDIPYGEVITYGDIAKKIALKLGRKSMSAQAIGGAVGHNPISIIIPCHRVIGSTGNLTGYAAGIEVKQKLLKLENANLPF